jgi:hypothetical protein
MIDSLKPNEREYYKKRRDLIMTQTLGRLDPDDPDSEDVIYNIEVNELDSVQTIDFLLEHDAGQELIYNYLMKKVQHGAAYKDLPEGIVYELLVSKRFGYNTARYIVGLKNLDADMLDRVFDSISSADATAYATEILKGKNVPAKLIDKIKQTRYGVSSFADYYKKVLNLPASELPPLLLQYAMRDAKVAEEIYAVYAGKGLPEGIVNRVKNYYY